MKLIILVPREGYIEVIEVGDELKIRKLPRSYDFNQLKEGWG
ncbi:MULTISPECIES: hypothetical protein [unclassified Archaeoglobus]|jgi:hypothetical protein|nr:MULTISPECIES: hypothetical protein [unclassified Archaeoglobus]